MFSSQVGLQIHLMHGCPARSSAEAVQSMCVKACDHHSHVHIWYWSAAIAQHRHEWLWAYHFFRRAARCTQLYLHLSMQAKALSACCEVVLSYFTHSHFPALLNSRFAALRDRSEPNSRRCYALHAELCREMNKAVTSIPPGDALMDWRRELEFVRSALHRALDNARKTSDNGVELRALLIAQFVLKMDGVLTYTEHACVEHGETVVSWLPGSPTLAAIEASVNELLTRLQRNVLVIRRLMACNVTFDPMAIWQLAGDAYQAGREFDELGM